MSMAALPQQAREASLSPRQTNHAHLYDRTFEAIDFALREKAVVA